MKIMNSPTYYLYDYLFDKYIMLSEDGGDGDYDKWEFVDKDEATAFHFSAIMGFFKSNTHLQPDDYLMVATVNEEQLILKS